MSYQLQVHGGRGEGESVKAIWNDHPQATRTLRTERLEIEKWLRRLEPTVDTCAGGYLEGTGHNGKLLIAERNSEGCSKYYSSVTIAHSTGREISHGPTL